MKTKGELIIEALKTGNDLSLSEIVDYVSKSTGQQVRNTDVSPVLSKLSRPDKSDIGFFIQRRKKPKNPYRYKLVDEALEMTNDELLGLFHKNGKNRFTLADAVEQYPGIEKYVKSNVVKPPKDAKRKRLQKAEAVQDEAPVENDADGAYDREISEAIKAVRIVLAQGLNINVTVNIRL